MNLDNQTAGRLAGLAFAGAAGLRLITLVVSFFFGYNMTFWSLITALIALAGMAALAASGGMLLLWMAKRD